MARAPRLRWAFPTAVAMRVAQRKPGHVRPHQQVAPPRPAPPPHTHASPAVKLRLSRTHTHTHATPHAMKLRLNQTHTHRDTSSYEASAELLGCEASAEPHTHTTHSYEAPAEPHARTPHTAVKLRLSHKAMRLRPSLLQHTHLDVCPPPGGSCLRHVTNHT